MVYVPNDNYQTIRISKEAYEKLREIKFKHGKSYVEIINTLVEAAYESLKDDEGDKCE